jgi:hypothetical protein
MRQAELVSALTLLGLFEHWVWAVALFIAYTDWVGVEEFWITVLRRSRNVVSVSSQDVAGEKISGESE